jgi:hypothetical protein
MGIRQKIQPEAEKVRGVLWSLILAFTVSFLVANTLITLFILSIGLIHPEGMSYVLHRDFDDMQLNIIRVIVIMGLESLAWGSGLVTFTGARNYRSLKFVFFRALFGSRGGRSIGPTIIRREE